MMNLTNTQKGTLFAFIGVMIITPDTLLIRLISLDTWSALFIVHSFRHQLFLLDT
jgi:hypothetical protein